MRRTISETWAPDRPGFTFASGIVGAGVVQLEEGYTYESARQEGSALGTFSEPQALARLGIVRGLEIRFSTNGYSWQALRSGQGRSVVSGLNDMGLGAKFKVLEQSKARPEVSIIANLSLPAAGSAFTSSGHDPSFTLAGSKDLPGKLTVMANANFASITDAKGRIFNSGESIRVSRNAGTVSIFAEVLHTSIARGEGSEVEAAAGVFRSLGKNAQVDVEAGHTVSGARPSWYSAMGFVFRDPRPLFGPGWFRPDRR